MCATIQYIFRCDHPATGRFRNELCASPGVRGCWTHDTTTYLRYPCKKCAMQDVWMMTPVPVDDGPYNDTWYIPSICFVDVGFRSLDPFQDDRRSVPKTSTSDIDESLIPPEMVIPEATPTTAPRRKSFYKRLVDRLINKRPSPCCAEANQSGDFRDGGLECAVR